MQESLLFSFKDVDIYPSQASFLHPRKWLDDTCINFCFRLMEDTIDCTEVLFLDPAIVSFLRLQVEDEDEFRDLSRGQDFESRQWLFIPISDSNSFQSSGTHWSLLLLHHKSMTPYHIDSSGDINFNSTKALVEKFASFTNQSYTMVPLTCPQQNNNFDCGVYVILFTEILARHLVDHPSSSPTSELQVSFEKALVDAQITAIVPSEYRQRMIRTIEEISQQYKAKKKK